MIITVFTTSVTLDPEDSFLFVDRFWQHIKENYSNNERINWVEDFGYKITLTWALKHDNINTALITLKADLSEEDYCFFKLKFIDQT